MLRLKNICKDYKVATTKVHALKNINLSFRKSEFVSVLGPSGCGKTTMLNIIGGLDKYTSGELFVSGKSTKNFRDKDWDVYRNHRIGFIFQSYNLIPHQTILGNVELALSIAGLNRKERVKKAQKALDKVGLAGEYNKRPNQLSGGQCQRVAIARALVNDPEILLADEPTGALDTVTSVQIMELIKEISKDKLVIMVTHNPELAERYSNRIINLLDGEVVSDSNIYNQSDEESEHINTTAKQKRKEKAKMKFLTALNLSFKNLFSKKTRTIMTSIAGAIGIIGVSLVLSVSCGVKSYINSMQNDMLSGNPIKVTESAFDLSTMMKSTTVKQTSDAIKEEGFVNVDSMIEYLVSSSKDMESILINNTITEDYINYVSEMPKEYVASILLDYGIDVTNNIYTDFKIDNDSTSQNMSLSLIKNIYTSVLNQTKFANYSGYVTSLTQVFDQSPNDEDYIRSQYEVLYGDVATEKDEIMIVLEENSMMTDLLLAQLGYFTQEQFLNIIEKASNSDNFNQSIYKNKFSFDELIDKEFTWYPNDEILTTTYNPVNPFVYNPYHDNAFQNGLDLKIVGILEPKDTISYGCLTSGFYYTEALTKYIIESNLNSAIVTYLSMIDKDSITSMHYDNGTESTADDFEMGVTYEYSFSYDGIVHDNVVGYMGTPSTLSTLMATMGTNISNYYTLNLHQLGGMDMPSGISIYPVDFVEKDFVLGYLDKWNSEDDLVVKGISISADDREEIKYTDNLSVIIALVNNLINIVTYALVAFTGLSLVVSCVMIGIITYVSVVERTKEIGVIRSLGGRKRDVSNLFNAETFIIGLSSGLFGIGVTYFLSFIANLIVNSLSGVSKIAIFPWHYALVMVLVSIGLTLIAGIIPSKSAAKKDPAVALRTE